MKVKALITLYGEIPFALKINTPKSEQFIDFTSILPNPRYCLENHKIYKGYIKYKNIYILDNHHYTKIRIINKIFILEGNIIFRRIR